MSRTLSCLAALALVIPSGYATGVWSRRWSTGEDFAARVAALGRIPAEVDGWKGTADTIDPRLVAGAGVDGGVMWRFTGPGNGAVSIMLLCGKPGPTSVHTPELCYAGAGFEATRPKAEVVLPAEAASAAAPADHLWASDFVKEGPGGPEYLRVFHAWSFDGTWKASSQPRLDFAGAPALYKLYAVRPMAKPGESLENDPAVRFLSRFLPELRRSVWRPTPVPPSGGPLNVSAK